MTDHTFQTTLFTMEKYFESLAQIDITQGFSPEKIYITSDLHLFHKNIIKYVNRPFDFSLDGCSKMNEFLLKKFDELPENCVIWILGDVILNRSILQERTSAVIWRMKQNRNINLILGNHDKQCKKEKDETYIEYFSKSGFDMVFNKPIIFDNKLVNEQNEHLNKDFENGNTLVNLKVPDINSENINENVTETV